MDHMQVARAMLDAVLHKFTVFTVPLQSLLLSVTHSQGKLHERIL